jgi:AraC family transcriptional regulator
MLRALPLFQSPLVCIERCDHPPDVPHVDPDEERSSAYCVSFVERGAFSVTAKRRTWSVGTSELFVTVPGMVYRCDHHDNPDDVCLCVGFGAGDDDARDLRALARRAPVAPLTNRRAYLQRRLTQRIEQIDPLAIESIAGEILHDMVDGAVTKRLYGSDQLAWYARRVDAARDELESDYASPHSLTSLARSAGMSPFHFARVFRELTNVPPHRYLVAVRLRAAVERLRQGDSVTDACFAVGFNSLGHFIEMFRRTYGVSPSRFH